MPVQVTDPRISSRNPRGRAAPVPHRFHRRAPPGRRVKETKWRAKLPTIVRGIMGVAGFMSEIGDFVDAVWDALPKKAKTWSFYKGRPIEPNWRKKAMDIYRNIDDVDMNKALKNFITNQVQDEVVGRLSSATLPGAFGFSTGWHVQAGDKYGTRRSQPPRNVDWWEVDQDWSRPKW